MYLVPAPEANEYFQDLEKYGAAYHRSMDFLDLMDVANPEARTLNGRVSMWSPCCSIELWRAAYTKEVVGVQFVQPAALSLHLTKEVPRHAGELLEQAHWCFQKWVNGGAPHLEFSPSLLARAQVMHRRAREFFEAHPHSATVPEEVWRKMTEACAEKARRQNTLTH